MKKLLSILFCFSLVVNISFTQDGSNFKEIKLEECSKTINENGTYTHEIKGHKLKGPRGVYETLHINCDDRFLNIFCLDKFNSLLILSSRFIDGSWEQYGAFQVYIPGLELHKKLHNIEFQDINTVYVAYENNEMERKSYVIRLTNIGYSSYQYLNDPFIYNTEFEKRVRFQGRPKF